MKKETYENAVKRFAKANEKCFAELKKFANENGIVDEKFDALCTIVDKYVDLNSTVYRYANKHGYDIPNMTIDISNESFNHLDETTGE